MLKFLRLTRILLDLEHGNRKQQNGHVLVSISFHWFHSSSDTALSSIISTLPAAQLLDIIYTLR